jgi:hypothetical protein
MNKYFDAEKFIKEFEKMIDNIPASVDSGAGYVIDEVYKIFDSLQQEKPEPTCKTCGFYENNCPFIRGKFIVYPNKVCKDYTYSAMKEQEQLEAELEKELIDYYGRVPDDTDTISVARHFYELGLNARKEK